MHLTLVNLTEENISYRCILSKSSDVQPEILLTPSLASQVTDFKDSYKLALLPVSSEPSPSTGSKEFHVRPEALIIRLSLALGTLWRIIPVRKECPWIIYLSKVDKAYHRLYIIPRRDLSSFLSDMPDTLPLSSLCLPGTHDTMALYGWPISQCQELITPLSIQLQSGIRVLDVRLAIIKNRLIAYHGIYPQRTPFQEVLATIHSFLTAPSSRRETLVMSIKQEDFAKNSYLDFSRLVHEEIFNGPGGQEMWFLRNRIPSLGEVRGKVVMFSRFGGNGEGWQNGWEGLGIHPLVWPDSGKSGFSWQCKDTLVRTHDWYNLKSFLAIPEKFASASQILLPAPNNPPMPILNMTFFSAASFPLALPPTIAKGFGWPKLGMGVEGINSRLVQWLLNNITLVNHPSHLPPEEKPVEQCQRIRGWALLDFYDYPSSALTPLLVECNYKGRKKGEEGW